MSAKVKVINVRSSNNSLNELFFKFPFINNDNGNACSEMNRQSDKKMRLIDLIKRKREKRRRERHVSLEQKTGYIILNF